MVTDPDAVPDSLNVKDFRYNTHKFISTNNVKVIKLKLKLKLPSYLPPILLFDLTDLHMKLKEKDEVGKILNFIFKKSNKKESGSAQKGSGSTTLV